MTELCEYAANVDIEIARESIRAVGKIALQQYDVNAIVDRLLQFLEMEKDYVTAETLVNYHTYYAPDDHPVILFAFSLRIYFTGSSFRFL